MEMSLLTVSPDVGSVNLIVHVSWALGEDIPWTPTMNDEVRLLTSSGVLISRATMYEAQCESKDAPSFRLASCQLICPPFTGGFVLCLVDCGANRRVLSTPFRVAGPPYTPKQGLSFERSFETVQTYGRLDVKLDLNDVVEDNNNKDFVLVICQEGVGDNSGYSEPCIGPYHHADRVCLLPLAKTSSDAQSHVVSLVAPKRPGRFQVRCMATPPCGIPYTRMVSPAFDVVEPESLNLAVMFEGNLTIGTSHCMCGEPIDVEFNFTSPCGSLLNPLDSIIFYPFGRSEGAIHHAAVTNIVGQNVYKWKMRIDAPLESGFYDVAYYSFTDQRPVVNGKPLTVDLPTCSLHIVGTSGGHHDVARTDGELVAEYRIEDNVFSLHDRILIFDDLTNLVASSCVEKPKNRVDGPQGQDTVLVGACHLTVYLTGRYTAKYFSAKTATILCRAPGYIAVHPPNSRSLPTASLSLPAIYLNTLSVPVAFTKEGNDTRTEKQDRDCLCLYPADTADCLHTSTLDDPAALPYVFVYYLRGAEEVEFSLPPLVTDTDGPEMPEQCFALRYMVTMADGFRICLSEARIILAPPSSLPSFKPCQLAGLGAEDKAVTVHRFAYDDPELGAPSPSGSVSGSKGYGSSKSVKSSASALTEPSYSHGGPVTSLLHFTTSGTEFTGAVLEPRICCTTDHVVVTYHITSGVPRSDDKIVLFNSDCTKIISETAVSFGNGRPDFSLGTVIMNPPRNEGRYIAGYFSEKYRSIVLVSPVFRILQGDGSFKITNPPLGITCLSTGNSPTAHLPLRRRSTLGTQAMARIRAAQRPPRTRVLIIAVSYLKHFFELKGPLNDVELLVNVAKKFFLRHEDDDENLKVLHELHEDPSLHPTAVNIRLAMQWLVDSAQPKDQLVLHFSGCGSYINDEKMLLPVDYDWSPRMLGYKELRTSLFEAVPSGCAVTAFVDACFCSTSLDVCGQANLWRETSRQPMPLGVSTLHRKRENAGIGAKSQWRCVHPPQGLFKKGSSDEDQSMKGILHPTFTTKHQKSTSTGEHSFFVLYEASREASWRSSGAWDVFLPHAGRTVGLFTHALSCVLEEAMSEGGDGQLQWWELHERVCRKIAGTPYRAQHPRLCSGDESTLSGTVRFVTEEKGAESE